MRPLLTRRAALALGGLGGLSLLARARADSGTPQRRFLFVHCYGGWDTTYVFQPNFGSSTVDMEPDATAATISGIPLVDSPSRPFTRAFFEDWGDRCCVINGIEVRSVTHERCSRIVLTGGADTAGDDWGARIAAEAAPGTLLPYLVFTGRAFTAEYTDRVVRVGRAGQLGELLSGDALARSDSLTPLPSAARQAAVDAFVRSRYAADRSAISQSGGAALDDLAGLAAWSDRLAISDFPTGCQALADQLSTVWDAFQLGLARSALVEYRGWCDMGWDTHSDNQNQGRNFEELFEHLAIGLSDLALRTDTDGAPLSERVTVVVLSEMGRTPQLTSAGGRDHWTFTSAMLVGAGVNGGRAVGGYDTDGYGVETDFATGETGGGTGITAANLGATILALADVDPGEDEPVMAAVG